MVVFSKNSFITAWIQHLILLSDCFKTLPWKTLGFSHHCELFPYLGHPASFEDLPAFSFKIVSIICTDIYVTRKLVPRGPLKSWPFRIILVRSW